MRHPAVRAARRPRAANRKGPIKVQVSEPGAARKNSPLSSPPAPGEKLPEDVAALLDAFSEPAESALREEVYSEAPGIEELVDEELGGPPAPSAGSPRRRAARRRAGPDRKRRLIDNDARRGRRHRRHRAAAVERRRRSRRRGDARGRGRRPAATSSTLIEPADRLPRPVARRHPGPERARGSGRVGVAARPPPPRETARP